MDPLWIVAPGALVVGALLAAVAARRVRSETAALAGEIVALASLADEATTVRRAAEQLSARTAGGR